MQTLAEMLRRFIENKVQGEKQQNRTKAKLYWGKLNY